MKSNRLFVMQLNELINEANTKLPIDDIKNILEFIENNEFGIAFETFCTQLYEYDIKISSEFYEKIVFLGQSINIEPSLWLPLKELINIE
ncbi:MAG TPA: MafI family immunity protein [Parachlamydiaceae bacterium]|nr:MafI family immunity protein [Parachlamydiaceae bacterium]